VYGRLVKAGPRNREEIGIPVRRDAASSHSAVRILARLSVHQCTFAVEIERGLSAVRGNRECATGLLQVRTTISRAATARSADRTNEYYGAAAGRRGSGCDLSRDPILPDYDPHFKYLVSRAERVEWVSISGEIIHSPNVI